MPQLIAAALVAIGVPTTAITIGGVTVVAGATAAGGVGGLALLGGNLIFTGALVAASFALAPDIPNPEFAKSTTKQSIPPRRGVLGQARCGGAYLLFEARKGVSQDVIAIAQGETIAWDRLYLNDDVVTLDVDGFVVAFPDGRYKSQVVRIEMCDGASPEAVFADLVAEIADADIWGEDHRGDGFSKVWLRCKAPKPKHQNTHFPFGLPQFSAVVKQNKYFDPREVSHDWDDPSTWAWTDNPALLIPHYLGLRVADGGFGMPRNEVIQPVLAALAAEADYCDEPVPLKGGGTVPRWRAGGSWAFTESPNDVVMALLAACDGWMTERGDGSIKLVIGRLEEPTETITDDHILSISVSRGYPVPERVAGVIVEYTSPADEYATVPTPVYPPAAGAAYAEDDARILRVPIPWCQDGYQAQRLAKHIYLMRTAPIYGSVVTNLYGAVLFSDQTCFLDCSDDPDLAGGVKVVIEDLQNDPEAGTWTFNYKVVDFADYNSWDPATEEGPLQPATARAYDNGISAPVLETPVVESVGGVSRVVLTFDTPDDRDNLVYPTYWRLQDIGGGDPGEWQYLGEVDGDTDTDTWRTTLVLTGLPLAEIDIYCTAESDGGKLSSPSNIVSADTRLAAPGAPTSPAATAAGSGRVTVSATMPAGSVAGWRAYQVVSGGGFGAAIDISGLRSAGGGASVSALLVCPTGARDIYVTAVGPTGLESTPAGPAPVTVT